MIACKALVIDADGSISGAESAKMSASLMAVLAALLLKPIQRDPCRAGVRSPRP